MCDHFSRRSTSRKIGAGPQQIPGPLQATGNPERVFLNAFPCELALKGQVAAQLVEQLQELELPGGLPQGVRRLLQEIEIAAADTDVPVVSVDGHGGAVDLLGALEQWRSEAAAFPKFEICGFLAP